LHPRGSESLERVLLFLLERLLAFVMGVDELLIRGQSL
jgi:hypothetical protein